MEDPCMKLMENMMDILEMAQGYAMIATKYKMSGHKDLKEFYADMSDHMLAAAAKFHTHLLKKTNDPATAADGRKFYAWGHERATKKMAEIKMILEDVRRP